MLSSNKINEIVNKVQQILTKNVVQNQSSAIITELISNLSTFLRNDKAYEQIKEILLINPTFFKLDNINKENIDKEIKNFILNLSQNSNHNNDNYLNLLYLSMLDNLNINERRTNSKILKPIAGVGSRNFLIGADGLSIYKNKTNGKEQIEVVLNYATTSWKNKKDQEILIEAKNSNNFFNKKNLKKNIKQLLLLDDERKKVIKKSKILNMLQTKKKNGNEKSILDKLNLIIQKLDESQKTIKKNVLNKVNKTQLDINLNNVKKQLKFSINDNSFNSNEMLYVYIQFKYMIENGILDSIILENIKTGISIVFNEKTITEDFKSLFATEVSIFEDDHYKKSEEKIKKNQLINLQKTLINVLKEREKQYLKRGISSKNEIINIINEPFSEIINTENFNNIMEIETPFLSNKYFSKNFENIYKYLENSIFRIELDYLFDLNKINKKNDKINETIFNIFKLDENINNYELIIINKFISYMTENKNNNLTNVILDKLINKYMELVNKKILNKDIELDDINNYIISNEIKNLDIYIKDNKLVLNNKKITDEDRIIQAKDLINFIKNDVYFQQLKLASLIYNKKTGSMNDENLKQKIKEYYFNGLDDNQELDKFLNNFITKTYGGNNQVAVNNIGRDLIINKQFGNLTNEYIKRIKNFTEKDNSKNDIQKHIIMVVDYDNDGTLAKLIAEQTQDELKKQFHISDQNNKDLIQIVYTKNYNGVRGITLEDIKDHIQNYDKKYTHELMVMTADNGTSNIKEIDKILNIENYIDDNLKITTKQVLIDDHHPMESDNKSEIVDYYIKNYDNLLLFNPVYKYNQKNILETNEKNISGATSLYHALKYFITDKNKITYLEQISAISNIMDYVNIEHSEISNPKATEDVNKTARNLNLFFKYTLYFENLMNDLVNNHNNLLNIDFFDIENTENGKIGERKFEKVKEKLLSIINDNYNDVNLRTLGTLFIDKFLSDNNSKYLIQLFDNSITNKHEIVKDLIENIKNTSSQYLSYKYEKGKKNYSKEVTNLNDLFNGSFDNLLHSMQQTFKVLSIKDNKTTKYNNIEVVNLKDNNNKEIIIVIDHSIPAIPRKLLMDLTRSQTKNTNGVVFYLEKNFNNSKDVEFSGSARIAQQFNLPNLQVQTKNKNYNFSFKGHNKAAGISITKKTLNELKNISKNKENININIEEDKDTLIQYIELEKVEDFENLLNISRLLNNRKTGGLSISYSINSKNLRNVGINIENFGTINFDSLDNYKNLIKKDKNYSILLDFHNGTRLGLNGNQLLRLMEKRKNNNNIYCNFKYFNDTFSLDTLTENIDNDNTYHYKSEIKEQNKVVKEYIELIDELKNGDKNGEYVNLKLEKDKNSKQSNLVKMELNVDKLKNSSLTNVNDIDYWNKTTKLMKAFGMYKDEKSSIKNVNSFINNLEIYYNNLYQAYKKQNKNIKNFMITDVETNGFFGLIQTGNLILRGNIDKNGNWKLNKIKLLTTVLDKDKDGFVISPAATKLTKIDNNLLKNYSTKENMAFNIFLKEYPNVNETVMIAHNALFDDRALNYIIHQDFKNYLENVTLLDTMPLSKQLTTTGHYQFMSKLTLVNKDKEYYIGLYPEDYKVLNGQLQNKDNIFKKLKTIDGKTLTINNGNISLEEKNGTPIYIKGDLKVVNSTDTRLSSVSQNILALYIEKGKEKIINSLVDKNNNKFDFKVKFKEKILDSIYNWLNEDERWESSNPNKESINKSKYLNKQYIIKMIDYHFINNYYNNTLILTNKKRNEIAKIMNTDIKLYINIARNTEGKNAQRLFDLLYINDYTNIKSKDIDNNILEFIIPQMNKNKNLQKYIKEDMNLIELIKNLKENNELDVFKNILTSSQAKETNILVKDLLIGQKGKNNLEKIIHNIFEENNNENYYLKEDSSISFSDREILKLYYSNARQQKEYLNLFIKHINEIMENFKHNDEISYEDVKNFILNSETDNKESKDLNEFDSLTIEEKTLLTKSLIELQKTPDFSILVEELHNNFVSPYADIGIEGLFLPLIYKEVLKDKSSEEQQRILEKIIIDSSKNQSAAHLRKIMFNSAVNQFAYIHKIPTNNILIENNKNELTLKFKKQGKFITKSYTLLELENMFPKNIFENLKKQIKDFNNFEIDNPKRKIIMSNIKDILLCNNEADIVLNKELSNINKQLNYKKQINTEKHLINGISTIMNKFLNSNYAKNIYKVVKLLKEEYNNDPKLERFNEIIDNNFKNIDITQLKRKKMNKNGSYSYFFNGKLNGNNKKFTLSQNNMIALFKIIDKLENFSNKKMFLFDYEKPSNSLNKIYEYENHLNSIDYQAYDISRDRINKTIEIIFKENKEFKDYGSSILYKNKKLTNINKKGEYTKLKNFTNDLVNIIPVINDKSASQDLNTKMKDLLGFSFTQLKESKPIKNKEDIKTIKDFIINEVGIYLETNKTLLDKTKTMKKIEIDARII